MRVRGTGEGSAEVGVLLRCSILYSLYGIKQTVPRIKEIVSSTARALGRNVQRS